MYFSILNFANRNSRFKDSGIAVLGKFIKNCVFIPTSSLRYAFNPIRLVRYGFEHSRSQPALLKMVYEFCVFQKAKSKNAIRDDRNRKMQFRHFVFQNAHNESPCSKSILSDSIGIKAILSGLLGLKLRFWGFVFRNAIFNSSLSKLQFTITDFKKHDLQFPLSGITVMTDSFQNQILVI